MAKLPNVFTLILEIYRTNWSLIVLLRPIGFTTYTGLVWRQVLDGTQSLNI